MVEVQYGNKITPWAHTWLHAELVGNMHTYPRSLTRNSTAQ